MRTPIQKQRTLYYIPVFTKVRLIVDSFLIVAWKYLHDCNIPTGYIFLIVAWTYLQGRSSAQYRGRESDACCSLTQPAEDYCRYYGGYYGTYVNVEVSMVTMEVSMVTVEVSIANVKISTVTLKNSMVTGRFLSFRS